MLALLWVWYPAVTYSPNPPSDILGKNSEATFYKKNDKDLPSR